MRLNRRAVAEGSTNKDDLMPMDKKLADVSADRMRQPANQHPSRTGHGSTAIVVNSPFNAVPTDKTAGDAARGDRHGPDCELAPV